jgi:D-lactate dehydrogenase (cytochrome)
MAAFYNPHAFAPQILLLLLLAAAGPMTVPVPIERDPQVLASVLEDAAHVPGGLAAGVAFPRTTQEVASLVASAPAILPIGAQSSLTGGATPRGEIVLSTRALTSIAIDADRRLVRAGAGVPLTTLQSALAAYGLWYPPAPTFEGAFAGGVASTNAAGAATFKYGTTRRWVAGLTVVLADGRTLSIERGQAVAVDGTLSLPDDTRRRIPVPSYRMPDVPKLSAGYYATLDMDLVDLFVGAEGTLGVITDVTFRVVGRPLRCTVLISCADEAQALSLTRLLRQRAQRTWQGQDVLDVAAIEYMDAGSLAFVDDAVFARAGARRPPESGVLLLAQVETTDDAEAAIEALAECLADAGVTSDPVVALPSDHHGAARLFELREAVPMAVNAAIAAAKRDDSEIQKTAGDFIVPFAQLEASLAGYRRAFESRGLRYAIWGHVSDGNLHPNVVPRTRDEMRRGQEALVELARGIVAAGGSPLAEHGVGRSRMKQQMLRMLYGADGIEQMRAVKRVLDPDWKLSPGVLFARDAGGADQG